MLDNPDVGLRINPEVEFDEKGEIIWRLVGVCDLRWGSNKEDGKSVTGYILCFMGVPVVWKLKAQNFVLLSSSESEHVSISELVKEVLFVLQILDSLQIKVELPVKMYNDNMGAINMVQLMLRELEPGT